MITLCIPTLKRYDLLEKCISSAENGTIKPDRYLIVDNGNKYHPSPRGKVDIYRPGFNIGVARAWNYLAENSTDIRIISNDDIEFYSNTIEQLLESYREDAVTCTSALGHINAFSLFTLPTKLIKAVGYFDESISPNYAYFEDNDYHYRMKLLGYDLSISKAIAGHFGSATLKAFSVEEQKAHHEKFRLARSNYEKKWGGLPGKEIYKTPYGR